MTLDQIKAELIKLGVTVCGTTEDFYGKSESGSNGLWIGGEEGECKETGYPFFDYYDMSDDYTFGVLSSLEEFVNDRGYYFECNDPGTYMLWEN